MNDAPVANDDVIPEHAISLGAIRVAVIGGSASSYVAAAAQLDDSSDAFSIDADRHLRQGVHHPGAVGGADSTTTTSSCSATAALGWTTARRRAFSGAARASSMRAAAWSRPDGSPSYFRRCPRRRAERRLHHADCAAALRVATNGSTITVIDTTHPITDGIASSYMVNARVHELAGGIDAVAPWSGAPRSSPAASSMAASQRHPPSWWTTLARDAPPISARCRWRARPYSPDRVAGGTVDQIFERVVAWAAGARDVFAATDEDTPLAIDAASAAGKRRGHRKRRPGHRRSLGDERPAAPTVSIGADGNIVYDPTEARSCSTCSPARS